MSTEREHDDEAERFEERHRRAVNCPYLHNDHCRAPQLIAYPIEARVFLRLAHETLDLANAGQVIVQQSIHGGCGAALQPIAAMRGQGVSQSACDQERKRCKGKQGELRVVIKHHRHNDEDLQDGDDTLLDPVDQNALDRVYVFDHAGHQVTRRAIVEPTQR